MNRKNMKHFSTARQMPPLRHSIPGRSFDVTNSEVCLWLMRQPEIMQYSFDKANYAKDILYDPESGTWRGVDYGD